MKKHATAIQNIRRKRNCLNNKGYLREVASGIVFYFMSSYCTKNEEAIFYGKLHFLCSGPYCKTRLVFAAIFLTGTVKIYKLLVKFWFEKNPEISLLFIKTFN